MSRTSDSLRRYAPAVSILVGGLLVSLAYLRQTPYDVRNFDADAHLTYIRAIAQKHALPSPSDCSMCSHPPAYYLLAALALNGLERFGFDAARGLQYLSLALWGLFNGFVVSTLARCLPIRRESLLATSLVVFWPYCIVQSVRVSNDTLVDVLGAGTIYFVVRWLEERRGRWLFGAATLAVVGLLTKSSALSLVAIVGGAAAFGVLASHDRRAACVAAAPATGALIAAGAARAVWLRTRPGASGGFLGNAATTVPPGRGAMHYLTFDPPALWRRPWADVSFMRSREPTYFNHLLKSSLYGARTGGHFPPGTVHPPTALVLIENRLVLVVAALTVFGLLLGPRTHLRVRLFAGATLTAFVATAIAFHWMVPNDHHADFRFILPAVVPCSILYASGASALRRGFHVATAVATAFLAIAAVSLVAMKPLGGASASPPPLSIAPE